MNKINMGSIYGVMLDRGIDFDDPVKYYFPFNDKIYERNTLPNMNYLKTFAYINELICKDLIKTITIPCYNESIYVMDEASYINDNRINIFQRAKENNLGLRLTSTALDNYREVNLIKEKHTMDNIIDIYEYLYDQIECMGITNNTGGL